MDCEDFVKLDVSNSKNDNIALEIKFAKSLTVEQLKRKLEIITGGSAATMKVALYSGDKLVLNLLDDNTMLGALSIMPGMRIHVVDSFLNIASSDVEKFDLTEDQYAKKTDTVRNFLLKNRIGKYNEEEMEKLEQKRQEAEKKEQEKMALCTVGSRCEVRVPGNPTRRGTVMYKGALDGKSGNFVGIKYDEPLGKNDGTFGNKRYFECEMKYGGFVSPMAVECGDFPPESLDLDDDDEI